MSNIAARRFFEEISTALDKHVVIVTTSNKKYDGVLVGFEPTTLSLCLANVKSEDGEEIPKMFINGRVVAQFFVTEKPFNLKGLAERLEKVFPKLVKVYEDAGVILVMDKIRVTKDGVVEGSGPAVERVKKVYEEFIKEVSG
ncbi:MAG: Lsm family RNA-binding protein [Candidatus Bathyarchaeota archaeon]